MSDHFLTFSIYTFKDSLKPNLMKRYSVLGIFLLFLALSSCSKEAGEGGTSTITGKILINDYNSSGILINSYYAPEERVYIVYGDNDIYDDVTRTHFEGSYQFKYLREGEYTIFAYSDCLACPSGTEAVQVTVEITGRNETIEATEIEISR